MTGQGRKKTSALPKSEVPQPSSTSTSTATRSQKAPLTRSQKAPSTRSQNVSSTSTSTRSQKPSSTQPSKPPSTRSQTAGSTEAAKSQKQATEKNKAAKPASSQTVKSTIVPTNLTTLGRVSKPAKVVNKLETSYEGSAELTDAKGKNSLSQSKRKSGELYQHYL